MSKESITVNEDKSVKLRLRNVRLSFPSLFEPRGFQGETDPAKMKYQATFLMEEGDDNHRHASAAVKKVLELNNEGKPLPPERVCVRRAAGDGEKLSLDGYEENTVYMPSSNLRQPIVVDRDLSVLQRGDPKPYAGCYVNASLRLWWQNNKFGKRVNASLQAVQFHSDGEPFSAGGVNVEEEFDSEDSPGHGDSSLL